jgi:putative colanic acid biosynthesis acetyltransferase WcaF
MPLRKPPIYVGRQVLICADAFVGLWVRIEEGAVVAARAVVVKNVEEWNVVAGNPAKPIKKRILIS